MYNKKRSKSIVRDPSFEPSLDRQKEPPNQNPENFWACQRDEIGDLTEAPARNPLPLARIRKVMKSNPKVKMIRSDTPVLLAKASELFIMELTRRAWMHAQSCSSQTIRVCDIAEAVTSSERHSYLADRVNFENRSARNRAARKRTHKTEHKERLPPADVNVPSTKVATDIDQIQEAVPKPADLPALIDIDQIQQHIYQSHENLTADVNVPGTKAATDIDQIQQAVSERADLPALIDIDQIQQHIYQSPDNLKADHFIEVDELDLDPNRQ